MPVMCVCHRESPAIHDMTLRHHDQEALRKSGYELTYTLRPLLDLHSKAGEVKNMVMMLGILAFAFCSRLS